MDQQPTRRQDRSRAGGWLEWPSEAPGWRNHFDPPGRTHLDPPKRHDLNPNPSAACQACGPVNLNQRQGGIDAVQDQVTVFDHRRRRGPASVAATARQFGQHGRAAEQQDFRQTGHRGEGPTVPPRVRAVEGQRISTIRTGLLTSYSTVSYRVRVTARPGMRKFSLARTRGTIPGAAMTEQGLPTSLR